MAPRVVSILFESNAAQAAAQIAGVGGALKGFGADSTRIGGIVANSGGVISKAMNAVGLGGITAGKQATQGAQAVQQSFAGMEKSASTAGAASAGPIVAIGVAAAATGAIVLKSVDQFAASTAEVRKYQRAGIETAEDSSKLNFAMNRLGIESDTGAASVGRLAQRIGQGKVDLDKWGVSVEHNKNGQVDMAATMENVSQKFSSLKDPTERAAFGMELFGKSWQKLIPFLSQGKDELKKFYDLAQSQGLVFNQKDLDMGREYSRAIHDLGTAWEGLQVSIGRIAIPVITEATRSLGTSVSAVGQSSQAVDYLGYVLGNVIGPVKNVLGASRAVTSLFQGDWDNAWKGAVQTIPGVGNALDSFTGLLDDGSHKEKDWNAQLQDSGAKLLTAKQGTKEYTDAQKKYDEAAGHLTDQQNKMADATQSVADKQKQAKVEAEGLSATMKDETLAIGGAESEMFKLAGALGQRVEAEGKADKAHAEFMTGVAAGNQQQTEAAALSSAAARQQQVYSDTLARTQSPQEAARAGAQAYTFELRAMANAVPPDSPLRARLELDLQLMQMHAAGLKGLTATMWADVAAITQTGGQNIGIIEQTQADLRLFIHKNHKTISVVEEQALWNDLNAITATGGQNQAIIDKFHQDQRAFQKDANSSVMKVQETDLGNALLMITTSNNAALDQVGAAENQARELLGADGGARFARALEAKLAMGVPAAEAIMQTYNETIAAKANDLLTSFGGQKVNVPAAIAGGGGIGAALLNFGGPGTATGGVTGFAKGGAPCLGCADPSVEQVAPDGSYRVMAESGTGGEMYLPKKGISKDRAGSILNIGASWYGMGITPMFAGGTFGLPAPELGPGWAGGPTDLSAESAVYYTVAAKIAAAKAMHDALGAGGASTGPFSGACADWVRAGITAAGKAATDAEVGCGVTVAQRESGCNPNAINNWDSNAAKGTPSIGLMQTIGPTFSSNGGGDIRNPVDNVRAATNYAYGRYGSWCNVAGRPGGYAEGAIVADRGAWLMPGQMAINKGNAPERILPPGGAAVQLHVNYGGPVIEGSLLRQAELEDIMQEHYDGSIRKLHEDVLRGLGASV